MTTAALFEHRDGVVAALATSRGGEEEEEESSTGREFTGMLVEV